MRRSTYRANELRLVRPAPPPDDPPLGVGERCHLLSGSPALLVVDVGADDVVLAWPHDDGSVTEAAIARAAVRRSSKPEDTPA